MGTNLGIFQDAGNSRSTPLQIKTVCAQAQTRQSIVTISWRFMQTHTITGGVLFFESAVPVLLRVLRFAPGPPSQHAFPLLLFFLLPFLVSPPAVAHLRFTSKTSHVDFGGQGCCLGVEVGPSKLKLWIGMIEVRDKSCSCSDPKHLKIKCVEVPFWYGKTDSGAHLHQ